ncbi:MAG: NAD-dependent epimerase/dehydratase family protein [Candidatus Thorarchaeota archaeon]|nr:MAG: NAD-dependent epimerase/dehydratase family protein [Candidatus Thorarchaeota archaeon]
MVRCFVTGGTGFVGSHIIRQLTYRNDDVLVLVRESSNFDLIEGLPHKKVIGDVTNIESLEIGIPDDTEWLFHNAAIMSDWGGKKHYFDVNVDGTRNILEVMRKKDIPCLIYTSSTAVYGFPNLSAPMGENTPWKPMNNYQKSKASAETLVRQYMADYGIKAAIVRAPSVFGIGDMFTGPQLIEFIQKGSMVTFGGGMNQQSYSHGEDFARLLVLCAEKFGVASGNSYNVTSFDCIFKEFLGALADELGVEKNFRKMPYYLSLAMGSFLGRLYKAFNRKNAPLLTAFRVKLFGSTYLIDTTKAEQELGYKPKWDMLSTVKDIVEWGGVVKPR